MSEICIIPPTELAVSLAAAKRNLRVDDDHMDDLITTWLQGIIAVLEHETGQCLLKQTWLVTLDSFHGAIALPHPVIQVEAVEYIDPDGRHQALAPDSWQVLPTRYKSLVAPSAGTKWPATRAGAGAVKITVVCGYGESSESTPANVRLYILAKLVEQFDPVSKTERDTVQSTYIDRLLDACRTHA